MILKLKKLKSLMILMPEMIRAVRERIFRSIFFGARYMFTGGCSNL